MSLNTIQEALSRVKLDAESLGYTASELAGLQGSGFEYYARLYRKLNDLFEKMSLLAHSLLHASRVLDEALGGALSSSMQSIKELAGRKAGSIRLALQGRSIEEQARILAETSGGLQKYISEAVDSLTVDYRQPLKAAKLAYSLLVLYHLQSNTIKVLRDLESRIELLKTPQRLQAKALTVQQS